MSSRACVACGAPADAFCARCGVTPYCSERCQRSDWHDRHSNVCHNLARMNAPLDVDEPGENDVNVPAAAPLRRPRSPVQRERDDSGSERSLQTQKFTGPAQNSALKSRQNIHHSQRNLRDGGAGQNFNNRPNDKPAGRPERSFDKPNRSYDKPERQFDKSDRQNNCDRQFDKTDKQFDKSGRQYDKTDKQFDKSDRQNRQQDQTDGRPAFRRPQVPNNAENWGNKGGHRRQQEQYGTRGCLNKRRFQTPAQMNDEDDEDWDASKPEPKPQPKQDIKTTPVKSPVKEMPEVRANRANPPVAASNQREAPPAIEKEVKSPTTNQKEVKSPMTKQKPPGSMADVTPTRKLIPKNCLIETLSVGDSVILSVDKKASECHTKGAGFICLTMNEKFEAAYQALCEEYGAACETEKADYTPTPGETFSYFNAEDSGWYRARCLSRTHAALIDSSKVVEIANARCVRLPAKYELTPEFCAELQAEVKIGDGLKCTLLDKTAKGWRVSLENAIDGSSAGQGELSRWLPTVQYPAPETKPATAAAVVLPEVSRPEVSNNSAVVLVHVTDCAHVFVRRADLASQKAFDTVLHDVALLGLNSKPLPEPPTQGSYVLSKYTDGIHYRALVKRTNVKQDKYLLDYLEFGNVHINKLENLYPCPERFLPENLAVMTSQVALEMASANPFTPAAEAYLDKLKEDSVQLVLTTLGGAKTAPSGSSVILTVEATKENVNKKIEEMCTPDWKKLELRGGDVLETECMMYSDLEYDDIPDGPCTLTVLDFSTLAQGSVSACRQDSPHLTYVLTTLTERMGKYCESEIGREPYLPRFEELCIAQMPPYPQWFRAVNAEQLKGPGGSEVEVCYIDYGNFETIPVALLRKMLPEFVRGIPVLANTIIVKDFPKEPTEAMVSRAVAHLRVDADGRGSLRVARCRPRPGDEPGCYEVEAPELLAAIRD